MAKKPDDDKQEATGDDPFANDPNAERFSSPMSVQIGKASEMDEIPGESAPAAPATSGKRRVRVSAATAARIRKVLAR